MIEVPITDAMIQRAKPKADAMGELRNSVEHGEGNLAGFLGEEVVLFTYPFARPENTYQHDVNMRGDTFEVKCERRPNTDYAPITSGEREFKAKVSASNATQKADFYIWVFWHANNQAYIVGYLPCVTFRKMAKFYPFKSKEGSNGFIEKNPDGSYRVSISKLWPPEELRGMQEVRSWPYAKDKQEV